MVTAYFRNKARQDSLNVHHKHKLYNIYVSIHDTGFFSVECFYIATVVRSALTNRHRRCCPNRCRGFAVVKEVARVMQRKMLP